MTEPELPQHVFAWLEAVQRRLSRQLDPLLEDVARELGPRRLRLLQLVPPGGMRQTDLAARASVTKQALGEAVDALVRLGVVERLQDPADGRASLVVLTRSGARVNAGFERSLAKAEQALVAEIGAKDYATFLDVLRRLGT